jgi:lantibiotic modifying enzyme
MKSDFDVISAGADSVFEFIRRTVEREGARCRWMTADYTNQFHYGINLFNGVGGIPRGGWNWSPKLGDQILSRCQWSHGAPGIGMTFLRAAKIFDDTRLLHAATMAGEAAYSYGDFRSNPTQCVGLAGSGDFLLELWSVTRESRWLDRALEFGKKILGYRDVLAEGDAWPTDAPGVYSADFMYGAAGIGHFLLRLETQGELPMPLIGRNFPSDHPDD